MRTITHMPAYIVLGAWFALQLLGQFGSASGSGGGVAYMAHIGGFIAGCFGIMFMAKDLPAKPIARWHRQSL